MSKDRTQGLDYRNISKKTADKAQKWMAEHRLPSNTKSATIKIWKEAFPVIKKKSRKKFKLRNPFSKHKAMQLRPARTLDQAIEAVWINKILMVFTKTTYYPLSKKDFARFRNYESAGQLFDHVLKTFRNNLYSGSLRREWDAVRITNTELSHDSLNSFIMFIVNNKKRIIEAKINRDIMRDF